MQRSFSMATLMLLVAIAAISAASIRNLQGRADEVVIYAALGGCCGLMFGVALAVWNRSGWIMSIGSVLGGIGLGTAAGAQMSARVSWVVLLVGPLVLIAMVWLVARNRRRQLDVADAKRLVHNVWGADS